MFKYEIHIAGTDYVAILNDTGAKVVWERPEDGALFRKRLDGSFTLNRSGNEALYDKLMDLTYCDAGTITVSDKVGIIISGSFRRKDLAVNEDKCFIKISFQRDDEYTCLDGLSEKDFNILGNSPNRQMPKYSTRYNYGKVYEYTYGYGDVNPADGYGAMLEIEMTYDHPELDLWLYPLAGIIRPTGRMNDGKWSLVANEYTPQIIAGVPGFHIKTTWGREVKVLMREGDAVTPTPPNTGDACDFYEWEFDETVYAPRGPNAKAYDKFFRQIEFVAPTVRPDSALSVEIVGTYVQTRTFRDCSSRSFDRCRKLNDVISALIYPCFPAGFESIFFKSETNPMSGEDLSNLLIMQKSDAISPDSSDPATRGILTFNKLMGWEWGSASGPV